jgi:hypothetical protein
MVAAAVIASILLLWSAQQDVSSTTEALRAGAVESHWLYRLAGKRWALLRWAVAAAAVALVWWAWTEGGGVAVATSAAGIVWSVYVFRVARQNRANAREMRERRHA